VTYAAQPFILRSRLGYFPESFVNLRLGQTDINSLAQSCAVNCFSGFHPPKDCALSKSKSEASK
jgi:hypothetical protein